MWLIKLCLVVAWRERAEQASSASGFLEENRSNLKKDEVKGGEGGRMYS